ERTASFSSAEQLECSALVFGERRTLFHLNGHFTYYIENRSCLMESPMRFFPVFVDLASGTVALVGSGPAALNKLRLLRAAGANVRWYSSSADVAEEVLLASPPSGQLELSFADPLQA